MPKNITIILENRPGTLADAAEALGRAGINIDGGCGFEAGGEGVFHVLVADGQAARQALESAGLRVRDERDVVLLDMPENRPGSLGKVLRQIANAGANLDLIYATADGRIVIGGQDVEAIKRSAQGVGARST
jgi:hypothetical protein